MLSEAFVSFFPHNEGCSFFIPAADVEVVRNGEWVESKILDERYVCSICGGACWYYDYQGEVAKSRYCPNCGAMMDGKAK